MILEKKINAFALWGTKILNWSEGNPPEIEESEIRNPWFTLKFIHESIIGISRFLQPEKVIKWMSSYPDISKNVLDIGIIAAGNIPLVSFHDLISVLITGNRAIIKLSHQDNILLPALLKMLYDIEPYFKDHVTIVETLPDVDAVIATGSDNTTRYFIEKYKMIPHLFRRNRSSCAVLDGKESMTDLNNLMTDMFLYYGLGCRNVSKLYVPEAYNFERLLQAGDHFTYLISNKKYHNNFKYQLALMKTSNQNFIKGPFYILEESLSLVSPLAVIYWEFYSSESNLNATLNAYQSKLQCIVSNSGKPEHIKPGKAQYPDIWDYADKVDTITFLRGL